MENAVKMFDAGDWLKLKETLEDQMRQANMTLILNKSLLKFVDRKLKCKSKKEVSSSSSSPSP